jgi:O-antigen/teichoic acid export membrane protein
MNLLGKLIKNSNAKAGFFYLIGNMFSKAIALLTIPIFTRILSTSEFGIVNVYLSWVSILSLIVGLSLGSSIRTAYIEFKEDLEGYISSIFFLSFINFIITSTLIILIAYFFIPQVDIVILLLCLIQSFMTFILNGMDIKYMMSVEYLKKTFLLIVPNLITTIMSIILILQMEEDKYFGRILPYVVVTSIIGSFYLIWAFIKGKKYVNKIYWKYAVSLSIPLIFHGLSINILSTSDRTMLTIYNNVNEAGIYSLVYSLGMVATVIMVSLESIWIPWFTKKMQSGEKDKINIAVNIYIEIVYVLMIVLLMVGPEILILMAPQEYWSGKVLIPPVLLASFFIFLYSISVDLEYYYKSTKIIATNTIIAAIANLGLNFIFIPLYGSTGAAYTTVAAYIFSFFIHYYAARRLDGDLFPFKIYIKPIIIMIFMVMISYLFMDYSILRWFIAIIGFGAYTIISIKKERFSILIK